MVVLRSHKRFPLSLLPVQLRWFCAVVVLAVGAPLSADSLFDDAEVRGFFATVVRTAFMSISDVERAAFIVQNDDGSLECRLWPATRAKNAEAFHGAAPPRTIAIVHTHPVQWPQPSVHDIQEAARLELPIYVVTVRDVFKIQPRSSKPEELVHGHVWLDHTNPAYHCETPDS